MFFLSRVALERAEAPQLLSPSWGERCVGSVPPTLFSLADLGHDRGSALIYVFIFLL